MNDARTPTPARGGLRVYLGAAPGVGKTYKMLEEGRRRLERGTDVVVAVVETHGRERTARLLDGFEVVPRRTVTYRGAELDDLDLDAVLARRPKVALVDEMAHTNAPGSRHAKRWEDIDELLDAGIDVITTVNIQHLESLNDALIRITGVEQHETIPDDIVRRADQIEIVDMAPEALRRRIVHGNVYPRERVDAALGNYFRIGNLSALRELALLWVADRVDHELLEYRDEHGIRRPWETRERIVVAITGAPSGEHLIRRAARSSRASQRRPRCQRGRRPRRRAPPTAQRPRRPLPRGRRRRPRRATRRLRSGRERHPARARHQSTLSPRRTRPRIDHQPRRARVT
jgi:two-component system, OmpR family, sensor histidine kinase KdpD